MALKIHKQLVQGTPEWLQARCGMLSASTIGKLVTPTLKLADNDTSRTLVETLAIERMTGHVEYMHPTWDMQRGTNDEPWARDVYAEKVATEPVAEVGFMVRTNGGRQLGYSPDGLVGERGLIEVKSRKPHVQARTIMTDTVPTENVAQLKTGLHVSGRDWIDYISYRDGMHLYVKRVYLDPIWIDLIERAHKKFEQDVADFIGAYETRTDGMILTDKQPDEVDMY